MQVIKITYGGAHITDRAALERFHDAIRDYKPILISNENLGGDPRPGVFKEFVIEYKNVNNTDDRCVKARRMWEGETLDFGWDIKYVSWGRNGDRLTWDKSTLAYLNLFWALDHNGEVLISCETMGCDPAPGQWKNFTVTYSHPQHRWETCELDEGGRLKFEERWPKPEVDPECVVM